MNNKPQAWVTINRLAELTGADRRHVLKWTRDEQVPSQERNGRTVYDQQTAIAAITDHQRRPDPDLAAPEAPGPAVDVDRLVDSYAWLCRRDALLRVFEEAIIGPGLEFPDTTPPEALKAALARAFAELDHLLPTPTPEDKCKTLKS